MIKTVVNEYHWTPSYVETLYTDDLDHLGLEFWYNEVKEAVRRLKEK